MSTTTVTVREEAALAAAKLDKSAGVARGVTVCGFVSLNGRDYPKAVLARDHKVYEEAMVYIDHAAGERKVGDWFGTLRGVRLRADGRPVADLHYSRHHRFAAEFEERAERFPRSFGLSHVAVCQTARRNGREVIEGISRVESVDLVARPATNSSLFEHAAKVLRFDEAVREFQEAEAATRKPPVASGLTDEQTLELVASLERIFRPAAEWVERVGPRPDGPEWLAEAAPRTPARPPSPHWWEPKPAPLTWLEPKDDGLRWIE